MVTISLCMIVKNESSILKRCLDSYKKICDEIIIVDTGSTDNTKQIASLYTDKIYDYTWKNDFSDARNFAFEKASCEYIFSADADEVLDSENLLKLLTLKKNLLPEIDIVQMYYVNNSQYNTVYNFKEELRPKLFKRLRTFTWISPIHETIRLTPVVYDSDIKILHMPENSHTKRDFSIFINAVNNGVYLENYVLIMFCKELFISGDDNDFLSVKNIFENVFLHEERNNDCFKNVCCVLSRIYRLENDYNNFFKICLKDMANEPCAEICMELGYYYYNLGDYNEAIIWFINASSETESIIDIHSSGNLPLHMLYECYKKLSDNISSSDDANLYNAYISNMEFYKNSEKEWLSNNN